MKIPNAGPQKKKNTKKGLTFNRKLLSLKTFHNPRLAKDYESTEFWARNGKAKQTISTGDKGGHKITQNRLNFLIV